MLGLILALGSFAGCKPWSHGTKPIEKTPLSLFILRHLGLGVSKWHVWVYSGVSLKPDATRPDAEGYLGALEWRVKASTGRHGLRADDQFDVWSLSA